MAIYPYRCLKCGREEEVWQSISSYRENTIVPLCHCRLSSGKLNSGIPMQRTITAPLYSIDVAPWAAYQSPIDGSIIDSRAKRNEHMAKYGVVMYDEIKPDIERARIRREKETTADLKDDIIDACHKLEAGYKPESIPESELIPHE